MRFFPEFILFFEVFNLELDVKIGFFEALLRFERPYNAPTPED
jgi:hypothetical protein